MIFKSVRMRLTVWFTLSCLVIVAVFIGFTYHLLELELRTKQVGVEYPEHPDWKLHGNATEEEVQDILGELIETSLAWAVPMALVALLMGYLTARKSLQPIASINQQLQAMGPSRLAQRIELGEMDAEYRAVVGHLNDLLARLELSFTDMSEYAAKVAHELRTPLSIMRLKLEYSGDRIPPDVSEDLQAAVHQLSHVIDQMVLMAKAEQGRLIIKPETFDLAEMITEVAEDFSLLAREDMRNVRIKVRTRPCFISADPKYTSQIIHNLLSNSLKHGQGDIDLRLACTDGVARLTIFNRVRHEPTPAESTLGLGLRVVDRLLHLQPDIRYRRRRGQRYYAAQIIFSTPVAVETNPS